MWLESKSGTTPTLLLKVVLAIAILPESARRVLRLIRLFRLATRHGNQRRLECSGLVKEKPDKNLNVGLKRKRCGKKSLQTAIMDLQKMQI